MIGYLLRGSEGVYKPRSQAGLGKGSHPAFQRVVGRLNRSVQPADERMDSVHACQIKGCLATGGTAFPYAPACAQAIRARRRARNATPCPPPHTIGGGASPQIFPTFFLTGVCPFSNLNDN